MIHGTPRDANSLSWVPSAARPSRTARRMLFSFMGRLRLPPRSPDSRRVGRLGEASRNNADDGLALASLGRVQGGDGIVEGRDVADVRPQSSVPHPLDDLGQLATIGLDDEVDRQAVVG